MFKKKVKSTDTDPNEMEISSLPERVQNYRHKYTHQGQESNARTKW